jgi:hypothetical protein
MAVVPTAFGVPVIAPVEVFSEAQDGRDPVVIEYVYPDRPPDTELDNAKLKELPYVAF